MIPKLICKLFGHDRDLTITLMNKIKQSAINSKSLKLEVLYCKRCGIKLNH